MKLEEQVIKDLYSNSQLGLALIEWNTHEFQFENQLFSSWIIGDTSSSLEQRIPSLKIVRIKKRLTSGKEYNLNHEIKIDNRSKIINLHFSISSSSSIFILATDKTKEKEVEYLLDSYVKMAEKNKRQLEESLKKIEKQKEELIVINEALERERNQIELRALQAVINPHFVSNCLASIQRFIVDNNTEESLNYLSFFGKLMRLSFEQSYNDYVSISDILQLLYTYASIEKIRIDHEWELQFDIDEKLDVDNSKIPPLLIQPFLENAIWHGINNKKTGGKVIVQLKLIDEITMLCTIEDNGIGRKKNTDKEKKSALHSLNVTGKRLDIMWQEYQKEHQITYTDLKTKEGTPCGTRVELFIPINF